METQPIEQRGSVTLIVEIRRYRLRIEEIQVRILLLLRGYVERRREHMERRDHVVHLSERVEGLDLRLVEREVQRPYCVFFDVVGESLGKVQLIGNRGTAERESRRELLQSFEMGAANAKF